MDVFKFMPAREMNTSIELQEIQRLSDKKHHEERLEWLKSENPRWACGTPVSKHEIVQMLNASKDCITLINDHGLSTNSVNV